MEKHSSAPKGLHRSSGVALALKAELRKTLVKPPWCTGAFLHRRPWLPPPDPYLKALVVAKPSIGITVGGRRDGGKEDEAEESDAVVSEARNKNCK